MCIKKDIKIITVQESTEQNLGISLHCEY